MRKWIVPVSGAVVLVIGFAAFKLLTRGGADIVMPLQPGPAQPRVTAAEGGIDPAAIQIAVDYAAARDTGALVVARGGHIVFEKYWGEIDADTAMRFDELSPAVSGVMLGIALNERMLLDLDMPLSRYLGDSTPDAESRTLRTLLAEWDAETIARVLEGVAKASYHALVVEKLWKPLGNGDIAFAPVEDGPRAASANASCCIRARVGDWMRFGQLLARDGVFEANQYAPPGFVHAMLRATNKADPRGYFLRLDGAFAARDVAWVGGADHQRLWVVPSLDLVILRMGKPAGSAGWDEAMIPDSIIRGTVGWQPARAGEGTDPKLFAPH
jgi:CubicO group peptidase (beta-lactamase class C family)